MLGKIRLISKMSLEDILKVIKNIVFYKMRKWYIELSPSVLTDESFLKKSEFNLDRFQYPFFIDSSKKNQIIDFMRNKNSESVKRTIDQSEKICVHVFDLLGSGDSNLGKEIDWHYDFIGSFNWNPSEYYIGSSKFVDCYFNKGINADVKVPWELSRFQHLITLGKAYWYTNNEKIVEEFKTEIESWIDSNPVELGINWACTMDVAIRAINWILSYSFLKDSENISSDFKIKFFKSLFLHGNHIMNNLETGLKSNHYLTNLAGLIYLGFLFKNSKEGQKWIEKGISELIKEIEFQVLPDGVNFELSTNYHRLTTEIFVYSTILCLKNGVKFPQWYMRKIQDMIEFILYYTKPDGLAPLIGDNDNGRLIILSDYGDWNALDHRYLLSLGSILFERPDLNFSTGKLHEDSIWMFDDLVNKYNNVKNEFKIGSKSFPDSGFYVMRDSDLYFIIDGTSPNYNAPQGHRHNSALSFELYAYDKSFIIDPGSYVYTSNKDLRNLFRSTKYHNVVQVDSTEQNNFNPNQIFEMGKDAKVVVNDWKVFSEYDFFDAEHYGYERLKKHVTHRRQVYFNKMKKYWIIKDILTGEGKHNFDLYFHFAPMDLKYYNGNSNQIITETNGTNILIFPLESDILSSEILNGWVSYSYGTKVKSNILRYSKCANVPITFTNLIYPFNSEEDLEYIISELYSNNNLNKFGDFQ